jgi:transcriptional regulator with XRE-family HTH domain
MTSPTLGERLRARRHRLGLKLSDVAERADLSLPYISSLERDRGNPTIDALQSIARALETTMAELTVEVDSDSPSAAMDRALSTAPKSLTAFVRSNTFNQASDRMAEAQGTSAEAMRAQLISAMATAPRRSKGDPTEEDWRRLLDVYRLILSESD